MFGFKNFLVIKNLDIISFNVYKLYLKYAFENFIKISSDMVLISSILIILYTETWLRFSTDKHQMQFYQFKFPILNELTRGLLIYEIKKFHVQRCQAQIEI